MEELLTVEEVCELLKISRRTLERWREKGLPFTKLGAVVRFKKADIEDWVNDNRAKKTENKMDCNRMVVGPLSTHTTSKEVVPVINSWEGSVVVLDPLDYLQDLTKETRLKKGFILDINLDNVQGKDSGINPAEGCFSAYIKTSRKLSETDLHNLDELLRGLMEFVFDMPLLIVLHEFERFGKIAILPELLRVGRRKNIYTMLNIHATGIERVQWYLQKIAYEDRDVAAIINNCQVINTNKRKLTNEAVDEYSEDRDAHDKIGAILNELVGAINMYDGETRVNMVKKVSIITELLKENADIIVNDSESEYEDVSKGNNS